MALYRLQERAVSIIYHMAVIVIVVFTLAMIHLMYSSDACSQPFVLDLDLDAADLQLQLNRQESDLDEIEREIQNLEVQRNRRERMDRLDGPFDWTCCEGR